MDEYVARPPHLFDRDHEWSALATFAVGKLDRPRISIVSGRRRVPPIEPDPLMPAYTVWRAT